jgi:hypothetical protein
MSASSLRSRQRLVDAALERLVELAQARSASTRRVVSEHAQNMPAIRPSRRAAASTRR